MAENKKSFILYADQCHLFHALDDEEAGRLIKHIFDYVNDKNPEPADKITRISFEPIKHQLKRDLVKYEGKRAQWSEAGKASAEAKRLAKLQDVEQKPTVSTDVDERSKRSTVSTVNATVNDNVNVTVNVNEDSNTTPAGRKIDHETFLRNIFASDEKREAIEVSAHLKFGELTPEVCRLFMAHLTTESKHHETEREFSKHLRNWLTKGSHKKQDNGTHKQSTTDRNARIGRIAKEELEDVINWRPSEDSQGGS